jgi:hypothetical protein
MFTPAPFKELFRKLYQFMQVEKRKMTFLINEAVEQYLNNKSNNIRRENNAKETI